MTRYAEGTQVDESRSRGEIERTLRRYGAQGFGYAWEGNNAMLTFKANGRMCRFLLPMPDQNDREFTYTPERQVRRSPAAARAAWEQACRQRWRAMSLLIKAKLEAIESGIVTFDDEFLAPMLLPNGQTVGQWAVPQIAAAYERNQMPALMPGLSERSC
ncbi:MAG: hypothetical protein RIN56_13325 [Sporomusaceae bacterium]|nr:hypothetical protein [Sporomusaceae bacterium]